MTPPPPPQPTSRLWAVLGCASLWLPTLIAAALLLPSLSSIPGLHGDEAWILLRVRELAHGARPWDGMNFYTGAVHQYLVWPFVHLAGERVIALRLPGALLSLAAVTLTGFSLRRLVGERTALACGLLLATAPAVQALARFAIEVAALTPFCMALALAAYAFVATRPRSWATILVAFAGGIPLGIAAYSHLVALPIAAAAGLVAVAFYGLRLVRRPEPWAALLGFAFGFAPRLAAIVSMGGPLALLRRSAGGPSFVPDLAYLPWLLQQTWDGRLIYQRFAASPGTAWPYPLAALVIVLGLRGWARVPWRPTRAAAAALAFVALASMATMAIAPHSAVRYFIGVLWVIPPLLGWLARPLLEHSQIRFLRAGALTIAAVVLLNVGNFIASYLVPFSAQGGGLSVFPIGTRLVETSNHFVRTDRLYRALRERGIRRVYGNFFITMPLRVHDRQGALEIIQWGHAHAPGDSQFGAPPTAIVFYDEGTAPDVITSGPARYARDRSFPPLFRVYLGDPASP